MTNTEIQNSAVNQRLAHILLIELLAYQFASPVKWIDTQDVLLDDHDVERFIEIGPSDTLVSMTRKTIATKYNNRDAIRHMKRKLLNYSKHAKELHYDEDGEARGPPPSAGKEKPAAATAGEVKVQIKVATGEGIVPVVETQQTVATPAASIAVSVASSIEDIPLPALDALTTITARTLKKSYKEIDVKKTVKQLAGGRSALENEIVGDFGDEFGSMPERAEDVALETLAQTIESGSYSHAMGKTTSAILRRLFSEHMPGGFAVSAARKHLQERWGLQAGRQDSVLLRTAVSQSGSRIGSADAALAFLDGVVTDYGTQTGVTFSNMSGGGGTTVEVTSKVDSKVLDSLTAKENAFKKAQMELYARFSGESGRADEQFNALSTAQKLATSLQDRLDGMASELGEIFSNGIQPSWSALKVRRYDSNWNWVLQDTLDLFYNLVRGIEPSDMYAQQLTIANRATPRTLRMIRHLVNSPRSEFTQNFKRASTIMCQLENLCEETLLPKVKVSGFLGNTISFGPKTTFSEDGKVLYEEVARLGGDPFKTSSNHIRTKSKSGWELNKPLTALYVDTLDDTKAGGLSFANKCVLITGASEASIGFEILRGLLSGGAKVIVTTSSYSHVALQAFQALYAKYGSRGAELIVAPFNQGSKQDLDALVQYIYDPVNGLGWDLDHVVPFAAISENGRELDNLDSKSELAHRIMLTNTMRLLGAIITQKKARDCLNRPAQVILPLSPNHGAFGNDGLYGESKIALETLFERWESESWGEYLSICGAVIGWTRGTKLMAANNVVAAGIEKLGVQTFSQAEMALCILGLMSVDVAVECDKQPLYADLSGGLSQVSNLKQTLDQIRRDINNESELRSIVMKEQKLDEEILNGAAQPTSISPEDEKTRASVAVGFPELPTHTEISKLSDDLQGMVQLDRVIVVTGFAEVGPCGSARTRWDMECKGRLSIEGCIEIAWMMGLIKNHCGLINGKEYSGWVDTKTNAPVHDADVKAKYEAHILTHTGIRLIEPWLDDGYTPDKKQFMQEIIVEEDLPPFSASKEMADQILLEHGDNVHIYPGNDDYMVRMKKGATIRVPRALSTDRTVMGQVPTGWDAKRYGIPEDIIQQVDRATLYTLVSVAEAFISSGVTDPYEFYQYMHVSEIGNCIGSGLGGTQSLKRMFKHRYLGQTVQNDILQETFINTTAAWVNMLLVSSSGPIRTPVGACATSIESLETGYETIVSGKAKMCLVGGYDDLTEAVSYEFANMKATSNGRDEAAHGRLPQEMSRPTTTTRSGFMEAHGAGIQIITSARIALDMGLPIQGIVAWVGTASDKIGRSVPAPGKGILTNARESHKGGVPSPLLSIKYRRRRLDATMRDIKESLKLELDILEDEIVQAKTASNPATPDEFAYRRGYLEKEAVRRTSEAVNIFGNEFYKNEPSISPIRGALAVWGLTIDDLDFVSLHGTSTVKNDQNETNVLQEQLTHLGRKPNNPVFCIAQKWLTGHSKGAAGAWMMNGALQTMNSGIVPGNRNADNIDSKLAINDMMVFPNRSIQTAGLRAFSLTSFGFGQKGAQVIGVHPKYLFASIAKEEFEAYKKKLAVRKVQAGAFFERAIMSNNVVVVKDVPPYVAAKESQIALDPTARASSKTQADEATVEWSF